MRYLLLSLCLLGPALAQSTIELKDGRTFEGSLAFAGEDIVITTKAGKKVLAPTSALKSVKTSKSRSKAGATVAPVQGRRRGFVPGASGGQPSVQQIQANIMGNPQLMNAIMALAGDPQLMAKIQDPRLLKLLMSGDSKAIEAHPAFKSIANDPRIKAIMDQVKKGMPAGR